MKKILLSVLLFCCLLVVGLSGKALAQTPTEAPSVKDYNITFPISELGNCADVTSCKIYCDDSTHQDACIAYAKLKGFYKDKTTDSSILAAAKEELGCTSADACRVYCQDEAHFDACSLFAKEHNLRGGIAVDPGQNTTLEKAKTILGCSSVESCKEFCSDEANQQKCSDFAKQVGLHGGITKVGPGGCVSASTCNTYCADPTHFSDCQDFARNNASGSATFTGPGGCNSESSCRAFCESNPTVCQQFGKVVPVASIVPTRTSDITLTPHPTEINYATYCNSHPGCTWTGTSCACQTSPTYTPTPSVHENTLPTPSPTVSINYEAYCTSHEGCNWTGTSCVCPKPSPSPTPTTSASTINYATYCNSHPGCTWTGTSCACQPLTPTPTPSVQGAATHRSLFQIVWGFILGK